MATRYQKSPPLGGKGNAVQWEAAIGWRALAQSTGFRTWWCAFEKIRTDFQSSLRYGATPGK